MWSTEEMVGELGRLSGSWVEWSQDEWLGNRVLGSSGVCGALATLFLKMQARGEYAFIDYVNTGDGRDVVMYIYQRQRANGLFAKLFLEQAGGLKFAFARMNDSELQVMNYLQMKGYFPLFFSNVPRISVTRDLLADHMKNASVHAVAVVDNPPDFVFFDPNFGMFSFHTAKHMTSFIRTFWRKLYGDMPGRPTLERYYKP